MTHHTRMDVLRMDDPWTGFKEEESIRTFANHDRSIVAIVTRERWEELEQPTEIRTRIDYKVPDAVP